MNDNDDNSSPGAAPRISRPRNEPASKHDDGNYAFWFYDPMEALREKLRMKLARMKEARLPIVFLLDMRRSRRATEAAKPKQNEKNSADDDEVVVCGTLVNSMVTPQTVEA